MDDNTLSSDQNNDLSKSLNDDNIKSTSKEARKEISPSHPNDSPNKYTRSDDEDDKYRRNSKSRRQFRSSRSPSYSRSRSRSRGKYMRTAVGNYGESGGNNDPKLPIVDPYKKVPKTCVYWKQHTCFKDAQGCPYIHGYICRERLECSKTQCEEIHIKQRQQFVSCYCDI